MTLCILLWLPMVAMAQGTYSVTVAKLNVRSSASTNGAVVGSLTRGATVKVNSITNGWAEIQYGGRKCFVKAEYLRASGNTQNSQRAQTTQRSQTNSNQTSAQRQNTYSGGSSRSRSSYSSADESGFASGLETSLGYSKEMFIWGLGFDLGYDIKKMLYIGVGPKVGAYIGDETSFAAGGYMKARFTVPVRGSVAPMASARLGYLYNLKAKDGGLFYGGDVGVMINKRFGVAFQFQWEQGGGPGGEGGQAPSEPTQPTAPTGGGGGSQPSKPSKPSAPEGDGGPSKSIFVPSLTLSLSF